VEVIPSAMMGNRWMEEGVDWVNRKAERCWRPYRMNLYRPFPPIHSKWAFKRSCACAIKSGVIGNASQM